MKFRGRLLNVIVILILLAGTSGPAAAHPVQADQAKAQPQLVQLAAQMPGEMVNIIVQKLGRDTDVESRLAALGGEFTKSLSIINAFAARMTAQSALELAADPGVRWISLDAPVQKTGGPDGTIFTRSLLNAYDKAVNADDLWAEGYQGSSVTVAVVDSGWTAHEDFRATFTGGNYRLSTSVGLNSIETVASDLSGHGTHVAGIIGGNGKALSGKYIGLAPKVQLISVKVTDHEGKGTIADVVEGLEWINNNRTKYNIKIVNLSLTSTIEESYHTSPLDAALEILWFNKIVVVVAAGNNAGDGKIFPPANDPFVITVGAVDDKGTASISDDTIAKFSAFGMTSDGIVKPDLVAPGTNIIAPLTSKNAQLAIDHPANIVELPTTTNRAPGYYFRMSGTSMSAPMVSGVVALMLQVAPRLNPDQVKARLMATARKGDAWAGYDAAKAGAGYVDAYAAAKSTSTRSANTGLQASSLLTTGSDAVTCDSVSWNSVSWNSVSWNSVSWNSVSWNSVSWNSVSWNSDYWGQ